MPRELARVDGENTRFCPGYCAHQARSTSSPNAVSAAPNGRGSAAGSTAATPRVTVGAGAAAAPHPARAAARPAAARIPAVVLLPSRMPLGRLTGANGSAGGGGKRELVLDGRRGPGRAVGVPAGPGTGRLGLGELS